MNQRTRIAAQDKVLQVIADAAKAPGIAPEVAAAIRAIGSGLAAKWGAKHSELPDVRRDAD